MESEQLTITPERKKHYKRVLASMTLLDDNFFNTCLQDNPDAALLIVRIVLRKQDLVFAEDPQTQKTVKSIGHKSVRFDLYCKSEDKIYDVEIQRQDKGAGQHRARYYSSVLDANQSFPGEDYDQLNDTYVIFITEHDIFGDGDPYYEIERTVKGKIFGDGSHILYVNGQYDSDDNIGKLMHDFRCVNPHDIFYKELRNAAIYLKETKKGVNQMCKAMEEIRDEGIMSTREENARRMISDNILPDEKIAEYTGLAIERVKELREEMLEKA